MKICSFIRFSFKDKNYIIKHVTENIFFIRKALGYQIFFIEYFDLMFMKNFCKFLNFKSGSLATLSYLVKKNYLGYTEQIHCNKEANNLNDCSTSTEKWINRHIF